MRGLKQAQIDTRLPTPGCVAAKLSSPQPALKTEVTGEATQPYKDKEGDSPATAHAQTPRCC